MDSYWASSSNKVSNVPFIFRPLSGNRSQLPNTIPPATQVRKYAKKNDFKPLFFSAPMPRATVKKMYSKFARIWKTILRTNLTSATLCLYQIRNVWSHCGGRRLAVTRKSWSSGTTTSSSSTGPMTGPSSTTLTQSYLSPHIFINMSLRHFELMQFWTRSITGYSGLSQRQPSFKTLLLTDDTWEKTMAAGWNPLLTTPVFPTQPLLTILMNSLVWMGPLDLARYSVSRIL